MDLVRETLLPPWSADYLCQLWCARCLNTRRSWSVQQVNSQYLFIHSSVCLVFNLMTNYKTIRQRFPDQQFLIKLKMSTDVFDFNTLSIFISLRCQRCKDNKTLFSQVCEAKLGAEVFIYNVHQHFINPQSPMKVWSSLTGQKKHAVFFVSGRSAEEIKRENLPRWCWRIRAALCLVLTKE